VPSLTQFGESPIWQNLVIRAGKLAGAVLRGLPGNFMNGRTTKLMRRACHEDESLNYDELKRQWNRTPRKSRNFWRKRFRDVAGLTNPSR